MSESNSNKQWKRVPFDIELAKKIQSGEIEGRIIDNNGFVGTIVTFNGANTPLPVVVKFEFDYADNIFFVGKDGVSTKITLFIELPEEAPKHEFKPFDKVLVRDCSKGCWQISFFSHIQDDWFITNNGHMYKECIPFAGNEHLVGTTVY